ncbi:hypothetical protein [Methylobacterium sp. Leaf361]|uniref:hypothetical protein n=1 Tax=Methylobacterium sp. Leaf361 TaxID=1736352 RepID=UPI000A56FED4|nr:hypothetical protein [Methylobacterium sp. Leaf361]
MQTLFSTEGVLEKDKFRLWRDVCEDRLVPMAQTCLNDEPFHATIEGASIGGLIFTKFALRNLRRPRRRARFAMKTTRPTTCS